MKPEAAIYAFMNGFSIPAYASSSVPDQTSPEWQGFPYITYDLVVGQWMRGEVNMPVNVWYRTDSEAEPNAKVREIAELKMPDLNAGSIEAAMSMVAGTARSMGVTVEE